MRFYKLVTRLMLAIAATATTQSAAFSAQSFKNPTHPTLEEVAARTSNPDPTLSQACPSKFDDSSLTSDEVAGIQPSKNCEVRMREIKMQSTIPSAQFESLTRPTRSKIENLDR